MILMLGFLFSCSVVEGVNDLNIVEIDTREYSWTCRDYADWTEIITQLPTCPDDGVLEASYILTSGHSGTRSMLEYKPCLYVTSFILEDEICVQLESIVIKRIYYSNEI